jgi:transposase
VPFIIEVAKKLGVDKIIHKFAGTHKRQRGLDNGQLALVWLSYMLSMSDHSKVGLEEWANRRKLMFSALLGQEVRREDFCDDRLSRLLDRLSLDRVWEAIESALWKGTLEVHDLPVKKVRVDATTCSGYHEIEEDGIMQLGHSKKRRPDLPQLKVMAGAVEGFGHLIAADVVSGNKADDPLYTPLIKRIRKIVNKLGLLYTGDCKMAALPTRVELVRNKDFHLIPLPVSEDLEKWISDAENGSKALETIRDLKTKKEIAFGYEFERILTDIPLELDCDSIEWVERVLVVRSESFADSKIKKLEENLEKATGYIRALTPSPGKGKRQIREEAQLLAAIQKVQAELSVKDLLSTTWERQEKSITKFKGRGRGSVNRECVTNIEIRYEITSVTLNEDAISKAKYRCGWRAYVTNTQKNDLSFQQAVEHYRNGYKSIERQFDLLKNRPLGLSPLYVRKDEQLIGLTRFMTIALRLLTLVEMTVQSSLNSKQLKLFGLARGQPMRSTTNPTGPAILAALARAEMSLYVISIGGPKEHLYFSTTSLPKHLKEILHCMMVSEDVYEAPMYEQFNIR